MKVALKELPELGYDMQLPPPRSCWPDRLQRLLLLACLQEPEVAVRAFRQWHGQVDIFRLDHASNRMMAMLYRNLERAGVRAPEHDVLKGNWRYHWYRNQMRIREYAALHRTFTDAGFRIYGLKGLPLIMHYYKDPGIRPMADFDVLVAPARAREAIHFLMDNGYKPKWPWKDLDQHLLYNNGSGFTKDGATEIDLHWHVLHDGIFDVSEERFIEGAVSREYEGQTYWTLCAEDHFLHLCSHGMRYNNITPLRWMTDAWTLLRESGEDMDCDRIIREAEIRKLANPVRKTLAYLRKQLHFPQKLPAFALEKKLSVSFHEHVEYFYRTRGIDQVPSYVPAWFDFHRLRHAGDRSVRHGSFVRYYMKRRKFKSRIQTVFHICIVTGERLIGVLCKDLAAWLRVQVEQGQKK